MLNPDLKLIYDFIPCKGLRQIAANVVKDCSTSGCAATVHDAGLLSLMCTLQMTCTLKGM